MNALTGFQRDILYILAGLEEANGSEIRTHLEEYYDTAVDRGQLYPNLDRLVERELIEKTQEEKTYKIRQLSSPFGGATINSVQVVVFYAAISRTWVASHCGQLFVVLVHMFPVLSRIAG